MNSKYLEDFKGGAIPRMILQAELSKVPLFLLTQRVEWRYPDVVVEVPQVSSAKLIDPNGYQGLLHTTHDELLPLLLDQHTKLDPARLNDQLSCWLTPQQLPQHLRSKGGRIIRTKAQYVRAMRYFSEITGAKLLINESFCLIRWSGHWQGEFDGTRVRPFRNLARLDEHFDLRKPREGVGYLTSEELYKATQYRNNRLQWTDVYWNYLSVMGDLDYDMVQLLRTFNLTEPRLFKFNPTYGVKFYDTYIS